MPKLCTGRNESDLYSVDNSQASSQVVSESIPSNFAGNASTAVDDRRRSERVDHRVPGWVSGDSADRSQRGNAITVCDMSMHGVGFHDANNRYRIGSSHWLVVNGGAFRVSTRVKIVSCRDTDEGGYYVGASFF